MDAKPARPRRNENAPPVIHQRHKSTGNLNLMASNASAGFRGPAKRAAFGDLTNLAKNVGAGRDSAKTVKPLSSLSSQSITTTSGKENVTFKNKDNLPQPQPRTILQPVKPRASISSRPSEAKRPATSGAQYPSSLQDQSVKNGPIDEPIVTKTKQPTDVAPRVPVHSSTLHPRHHKSQPDLKIRQQVIRRTQSRFIDKSEVIEEDEDDAASAAELSKLLADQGYTAAVISDLPQVENGADVDIEDPQPALDRQLQSNPVPQQASVGVEDARYEDVTAAVLSEPEDCWDEEEEEYDDDDQAYTTAHSSRFRDQDTGMMTVIFMPKVTARVQRELEEAKLEVQQTRTFDDIEDETWDVSMVAEYGDEIFEYMRELEAKMLPNPHYMDLQTEIQWTMRAVLMDWLVQVHTRFQLLPETLFLTVNYIDRFLSNKVVSIGKLQLVGATAILVASKYEEINCPSLSEIIYMVDGGYSAEEITKAERFMLTMLRYELGWPGPMSFLRRVSKADDYDLDTRTLAKYFLELTIMDERFVASPPSYLAAAAHCLSRLILRKGDWTKAHVHYSGYTWGQLKPVVAIMLECCHHPRQHHAAIYDKYCEKRFKEAATLVQQEIEEGFELPTATTTSTRRSTRTQPFQLESCLDAFPQASQHLVPIEG